MPPRARAATLEPAGSKKRPMDPVNANAAAPVVPQPETAAAKPARTRKAVPGPGVVNAAATVVEEVPAYVLRARRIAAVISASDSDAATPSRPPMEGALLLDVAAVTPTATVAVVREQVRLSSSSEVKVVVAAAAATPSSGGKPRGSGHFSQRKLCFDNVPALKQTSPAVTTPLPPTVSSPTAPSATIETVVASSPPAEVARDDDGTRMPSPSVREPSPASAAVATAVGLDSFASLLPHLLDDSTPPNPPPPLQVADTAMTTRNTTTVVHSVVPAAEVTVVGSAPSKSNEAPAVRLALSDDDDDDVEVVEVPTVSSSSDRRLGNGLSERDRTQRLRREGRLTTETLASLGIINPTFDDTAQVNDYVTPGVLRYKRGTTSQFRPSPGMPPTAVDSCETFSCVCVALFAALGEYKWLGRLFNAAGLNYITYVAAWLHEVSKPLWSRAEGSAVLKRRPTVADVAHHGRLSTAFQGLRFVPAEFTPLFYYQRDSAVALINRLVDAKAEVGSRRRRGYVIVAGDLSFGVVSLQHTHPSTGRPYAWSLMLTDSHGELPWAAHCSTFNVVNFASADDESDVAALGPAGEKLLPRAKGVSHFCRVLFALMEHCREHQNPNDCQYSTWVPIEEEVGRAPTLPQAAVDALDHHCIRGLLKDCPDARIAFQQAVSSRPARSTANFFELSPLTGVAVAPLTCWVSMGPDPAV